MPSKSKMISYRSRVVVKFHDYISLPYEDGVEKLQIGPWQQLVKEFPGITLTRLFTSLKPAEIVDLIDRATELDQTYQPANLLTYFVVDCPPEVDPERLAKAFLAWETVQTAYVEGRPGPPPQVINAANDPRWPNQGYLDPAPNGINAEFAWPEADGTGFTGGGGAAIQFVDLEQGWTLNHQDLNAAGITLISGVNQAYFDHGTSVLGDVVAVDNAVGCVGIAPHASASVVSEWRNATTYNPSDAILSAIAVLSFGDMLLLETQHWPPGGGLPFPKEIEQAVFDSIRLGIALGIIIVEAAGNGDRDLDAFADAGGNQIFNRGSAAFRDSGAIMVGAGSSTTPHRRIAPPGWAWGSNFGSRIDCYAWGEDVDTLTTNNAGTSTTQYTTTFGGTSSASSIVAGAALIVQGIAEANLGYRFSPQQLRSILSNADPAAGNTQSNNPAWDRIGVMPNLQAIIQNVLNATPDVYIRDFVGDTGDPHYGAISASPDIILLPNEVADPQISFGEGSGTENSSTLGYEATANQENYIYVRVRNRGGSPAINVVATVFWSPVATLITPDLWTLVDSVTIPNVPNGVPGVLTVSDKISWPANKIPGEGHYCFVGLIGNEQDPAPNPADFLDWDNFCRFIRENNNVTWRNFNVVPNVPPPPPSSPPDFVALPFLAPGAPRLNRRFRLEVTARLPKGARALLEAPIYLIDAMDLHSPFMKVDKKNQVAWIPLNPHGNTIIGEGLFPARSRTRLRLLVKIPEEQRKNEYEVFVSQIYEKEEVGRVTWRLAPVRKKKGRI
ncbi:MAG: S8 family peptidase [Promethearchaeota archaeon]